MLFIKVLKPQKVLIFFPLNIITVVAMFITKLIMIGGNFYIESSQQ